MRHRFAVRDLTTYFVFVDGDEGNLFFVPPERGK